eukprot:TRINITY_DN4343_c0_g1_i3.p1 TRINITY_DN4343_c0_g1~~TRINITY_DN4343_c0_g1_i3.p1  ORF type:complete len:399 (-),score=74.53 TRINITY_DN4343_c0_g1_i3:13-1209(-)
MSDEEPLIAVNLVRPRPVDDDGNRKVWGGAVVGKWLYVLLALVGMILSVTLNQVLHYRLARNYKSYTWFLGAIVLIFFYCVLIWPIILYRMYVSKQITPAQAAFPQWPMFIMAMLDCASGMLGIWPLPYISSSLANVLTCAVILFTVAGSLLFLKVRYLPSHYAGILLVLVGMTIRLIPTFKNGNSAEGSYLYVWIPVYLGSMVCGAASNVYKEGGLKGLESDVWFVNGWIGIWQMLLGLVVIPTAFIPWPGTNSNILPGDFGSYLADASKCLFLGKSTSPQDSCESVMLEVLVISVLNVLYDVFTLIVFKEGSSVLGVIASMLRLPLVDLLLLSPWISGSASISSITGWDIAALILLAAGIGLYQMKEDVRATSEQEKTVYIYEDEDEEKSSQGLIC